MAIVIKDKKIIKRSLETDPLNRQRKRSYRNAEYDDYNCGGFALNTYNWYEPSCLAEHNYDIDEYINHCLQDMIYSFDNKLRLIKNESELQSNEYLILFRFECNITNEDEDCHEFIDDNFETEGCILGDFHFVRKCDNGKWYHKRGHELIEEIKHDVFDVWFDRYEGDIYLLAMNKEMDLFCPNKWGKTA